MEKRKQDKNYFHKAAEGERSQKPAPTDGNAVKRIFERQTFSFFELINYMTERV